MMNEEFLLFNSSGQVIDKMIFNGKTGKIDLTGKAAGLFFLINQKLGIAIKIQKISGN